MTDSGRRLLDAARRLGNRETNRLFLGALAQAAGVALVLVALLVVVDRVFPLAPLVRVLGTVALLGVFVFVGVRTFLRRMPALRNLDEAARRTERQTGELKDRLVPAIQVLRVRDDHRTGYSPDLVDAFVDDTLERVRQVDPGALPYNESFKKGWILAGAGVAALVLVGFLIGPVRFGEGLFRLPAAFAELGPKAPATFFVDPGNVSIPRGESVTLGTRIENARIDKSEVRAGIQFRGDADAPWEQIALSTEPFPIPVFEHRFDNVRESFRYRFTHNGHFSDEFEVRAVPHPSLTLEEVRYTYPEYTGLPDRVVSDGSGDLAAVKGTRATLLVRSTNTPKTASLVLESGPTAPLKVLDDPAHLEGQLLILSEDSYHLEIVDALGLENLNPLSYRIRALQDEAPFVRLLEPGEDRDLDESLQVTLRFSAVDDYGLGPVELVYEVGRGEGEVVRERLFASGTRRTEITESFDWNLEELGLLPGDTVVYHLEVTDNNAIDGPSTARTREFVLRFPTLAEIYAEIDEGQEQGIEDLQEIADEAKRVEEKIEEVAREILKKGESSWENRKEIERALETQEKIAEQLREAQEEIAENLQKLNESEFMTLEAMQKMEKIQELMDELANEDMKKALEKLREAMEQANPRRMQEDLADFQDSQEDLMKSLDRIMENLKQFQFEERMKAAVRELEELAARQERVNDELRAKEDEKKALEKELANADGEGEDPEGEEAEGEEAEGEKADGEEKGEGEEDLASADDESESADGEKPEDSESSEASDPEDDSETADADGEPKDGEPQDGEQKEKGDEELAAGENEKSESSEGKDGEQGDKKDGEKSEPTDEDLERLAQEEKKLAEEAKRLEEELKKLAEMAEELRDKQDSGSMKELAKEMTDSGIPETMGEMSEDMQGGNTPDAQEKGEKALTQLEKMLEGMSSLQSGMAMKMIQISQAAINRAVRDLLSVSNDEEDLTAELETIPRNSSSATRAYADEQYLLLQGAQRVEKMLHEVAKDTPLMGSQVGKKLDSAIDRMKDSAYGLENGAVHLAQDDGAQAVEDVNAVVIALLETVKSMSSCASGMPMSGLMQQLQDLAGDQDKLNQMLQEMMKNGGTPLDRRLQGQMKSLAQEQQRIQQELAKLLEEMGSGQGLLGRLDDVSEKLDEVAEKLNEGKLTDDMLREQNWALTRLLDAQRSIRERDFGKERRSETADELADLLPPGALPEGIEELDRNLREDLLKALERRYPPKYEDLIRRYFRSLTEEAPTPDFP